MKSNLREGLFLLFWLLFFILLIFKEFKPSWIPASLKTAIVEIQIENRILELSETFDEYSVRYNSTIPSFKTFRELQFPFPVFIYHNNELVYWNNNEIRPPQFPKKLDNGLLYKNSGYSQSIYLIKKTDKEITYLGIIPLWTNVGIENEWLSKGSNSNFSFNWEISESGQCQNSIFLNKDIELNICFRESEAHNTKVFGGLEFAMICVFIILLGLGYFKIRTSAEIISSKSRKNLGLFSLFFLLLILFYEYSRRFLLNPEPDSVFFVVYPYLLAFFLSMALLLLKAPSFFVKYKKWIIPLGIILIYSFSKSYWIEIFDKESFDLDLINFVRFEWKTLDAYLGLFGMSLVFFITVSSLILNTRDTSNSGYDIFLIGILALSFFLFEGLINSEWYFAYLILALIYSIWVLNFRKIRKASFQTNIAYLISAIFLVSFFITETTAYGNNKKENKQMRRFADKALETQFEIEKSLLTKAAKEISNDKLIYIAFSNPMTSREIIIQKVKKVYLDSYFDPFEVNIDFLNSNGDNLEPQSGYRNLFFFKSNYLRQERRVSEMVYFIEPDNDSKTNDYFIHIELMNDSKLIGHILIEVFRDKSSPNSIFPKLLVDKKYRDVVDNKFKIHKFPKTNFEKLKVEFEIDEDAALMLKKLNTGERRFIESKGSKVLFIESNDHYFAISKNKSEAPIISSFSIVFMVLSFLAICLYWLIKENNYQLRELPFRQKIQFFMNLAFLLPLIIVSLAVLKFMNDNDRENVESNYLEKVRVISEGIEIPFLDYKNGLIPKRVFLERASKAAGVFSLDYFIYDLDGTLNSSSKEILWERGITNRLIEPGAYNHFVQNKEDYLIRENQINDFEYKIAYAALEDLNQQKIGILGVPFYESREELETRFIQLLSTVINIFVLTFIVFIVFSNKLTDWLMIPVLRLSEKIKITSFENKNEPLEWNTKDEIGQLVNSYNDMIDKLNESRNALARTEKEAAWKEMAQQVAHEIKNPLTPMRLRLQQLIRQQNLNIPEEQKLSQTLNSLLHQVDTLSEIASSFSEFARMPNPKNEKVNINEVIQLASNIYLGKKNIELNLNIPQKQLLTYADENMLSRSIGNIILNGIQSVEEGINPEINISLNAQGEIAEIRIKDNGIGIDKDDEERIFIPHFSTKSSGTGIGLALAKKTIESANGRISFKSDASGTEFLIELPLIKD
ncbi:HAMP domain-containing histidine kinase [Hyphobacterium sp. CCMP332]|nr:HAMP domain-containing histidine kinase [Hyphobacterium sp. CCMP332]